MIDIERMKEILDESRLQQEKSRQKILGKLKKLSEALIVLMYDGVRQVPVSGLADALGDMPFELEFIGHLIKNLEYSDDLLTKDDLIKANQIYRKYKKQIAWNKDCKI